jgi:hypothetical protein
MGHGSIKFGEQDPEEKGRSKKDKNQSQGNWELYEA